MKRIKYFFFLPASLFLLTIACNKSSSTDTQQSGNWVTRSESDGAARYQAASFVIGDTAYLGTGYDGTNRLNDFWSYDSARGWKQIANFPGVARNGAVGFAVGSNGYVATGTDGNIKYKDTWQYSPATNAWVQKADFGGTARYAASAFGIGANGYITCGYDNSYLKDLWQYTPATDTWSQKISFGGFKRYAATAFVYNNEAYVLTGIGSGGTNVNDFWKYTPATGAWTELRRITNVSTDSYDDDYTDIARNYAVSFVMNNKAYLTLGTISGYTLKTWEYDFASDTWARKTPFERSVREGAVAFTLKNRGFVSMGKSSSYYLDDLEEFQPNVTLNTND
ncbi:Kelch repeat-containing protein [Parasediminibacterium sp. JCM 36343]|uniref:Kelch repeat-containing protein n=1 Tax=Parasediminibacterium sp. JCM 36343 TaxID=3374279 RepID=UPI00397B64B2